MVYSHKPLLLWEKVSTVAAVVTVYKLVKNLPVVSAAFILPFTSSFSLGLESPIPTFPPLIYELSFDLNLTFSVPL